ncbi:MAG: hypothetical protein FJ299_12405 [Planctomycetes bacterium]|nr:hypothetical protein [Planctomycetota bacterium]
MSAPTLLRCPSCGSNLDEKSLDLARGIAKCGHCSALMTLPGQPGSGAERASGSRARPEFQLPANVRAVKGERGLELHRRWYNHSVLFLIPFCLVWNGFIVFWYASVAGGNAPWIARLFPIVHVCVGVWLSYTTLALLLNTTRIGLARGRLVIAHGPLPWRGNREIAASSIAQLYCRSKVRNTKGGARETFSIWLLEKEGRRTKLFELGEDADEALALEQRIERELGIADAEVAGELPR